MGWPKDGSGLSVKRVRGMTLPWTYSLLAGRITDKFGQKHRGPRAEGSMRGGAVDDWKQDRTAARRRR